MGSDGPMIDAPVPPAAISRSTVRPLATLYRLFTISSGYWAGPGRWQARLLAGGLVVLTVAQVALAIQLNLWSADLFDALERRDAGEVLAQSGVFAAIVLGTIGANVAHLECKRRLQLGWRRWLTHRMVEAWMTSGRQHQLPLLPGDHSNPDARIAEDIRLVTEAAIELGHSLLYCILLIVSFVSILWALSGTVMLPLGITTIPVAGHYVWLALIYAGTGSALAFLVSRPLVRATDARQTREANYRFELVRGREHGEAIALLGGEAEERHRLGSLFGGIELAWRQQTASLRALTSFTSAYSTLALMLPFLVAAPRFLASEITLGGLMQTAQAFQQLTSALSWPVDNSQKLAEMFASIDRVLVLENGLAAVDDQHRVGQSGTIEVAPMRGPALMVRNLSIAHPDGRAMFTGIDVEMRPGERVLILGDPQLTRTLFKVVAGVWPWGTGRVELPEDAEILFVPHHPYFPSDTLRHVLAYPDDPSAYATSDFLRALDRVGLARLHDRLDSVEDWDITLDPSEQQRLGLGRALLKRPAWLFLEEPSDALGPEAARALLTTLVEDLPEVSLLTISRSTEMETIYHRTLRLEPASGGHVFVRDTPGPTIASPGRSRLGLDVWRRGRKPSDR